MSALCVIKSIMPARMSVNVSCQPHRLGKYNASLWCQAICSARPCESMMQTSDARRYKVPACDICECRIILSTMSKVIKPTTGTAIPPCHFPEGSLCMNVINMLPSPVW